MVSVEQASRYLKEDANGPFHRTLLYTPFTPILVVFRQAIATLNLEDVQRLGRFVSTLRFSAAMLEGADKLYRLCSVFHHVAKIYVEGKLKKSAGPDAQKRSPSTSLEGELDPYLSLLGFDMNSTMANGNMSVDDWFGNGVGVDQYMMGLLETDLPNIDTVWDTQ